MASGGADRDAPSMAEQVEFWDRWNREQRGTDAVDPFMARQRAVAVEVAAAAALSDARILDVGCGTGWLGNALLPFGKVTGTDLSPSSIADGRRRHPRVELVCGDFLDLPLEGPFDLIVSADVISHVYDQERFVARIAELLRPGGIFLLMSQNGFVWRRSSTLKPVGRGQIRNWPSLGRIRALLSRDFDIEETSSIVPGGDRGLLFWVANRYVSGAMRRLLPSRQTWTRVLEAAMLGRELVVIARRR